MAEPQLSPGAWLEFLESRLDAQWEACRLYDDYFNGEQKLAFATAKFREAFSRYFPPLANNWCKLVCEAPVSRLKIMGFRLNPDITKASWDREADADAWMLWQANNLDAGSRQVHLEAIKLGVAYVLVAPPQTEGGEPLITVEHPEQVYVHCSAANKRLRLAAIKRWTDELDGYAYATVYLPTVLHKWRSADPAKEGREVQWVRRTADDPVDNNPLGVVPMIPIENTPDMKWGGRSDLEVAVPIQDAVNKFCLDMQVSSEFHAYPQRWASGWERATGPDGKELTDRQVELAVGQSRLIRAESDDTTFGTFTQGDVQNYIAPIELYIDHLAAVTQTPAYYLKGKMANLSADALHAADAGLVDRVRAKQDGGFSDGWEEVIRTAFLAKDDQERGRAVLAETIWADPETKSLAAVTDAAVKLRTSLSVPLEMCWEMLGWSPQQIQMAKKMQGLPLSPADAAAAAAAAAVGELPPADPAFAASDNGGASGP